MKVEIDSSRCAGHGTCAIVCGQVFDLDDDGFGTLLQPNPDESLRGGVMEAVENCPELAISVID